MGKVFPKVVTPTSKVLKSSSWSKALLTFGIVNHFHFSHSSGGKVVSHYGLNWEFSDEESNTLSCEYGPYVCILYQVTV